MANLGPIDFKALNWFVYIKFKVNVNDWQNKFKVHISKHLAKMAISWDKIGQMPLWCMNIKWA